MKLIEILRKMKVSDLKKEISKQNIKGYSKLRKAEIIKIMTDRPDKFKYLLLQNLKQKKELLQDKIKLKEAKDKLKKLTAKKAESKKAQQAEVIKPKPKREPLIPKIIKTKTGIITVKPAPKKSLSPLEDIKNYLNDTNNENYKNFINNKDKKEKLLALKKWLKVLKIKKENLLDSDIPYNVNNLFNENKLGEYQIFKDIRKRQKNFKILEEIQKVLNPQQNAMTKAFSLKDQQREKDEEINIKLNLKSEGLKSLLETVRINKLYEVFCNYYTDKQYRIKPKQTKEKIQQLNRELKKKLQTYKSGLYFTGVGCSGAPPIPKALEKLYREKLNDSTDRKYGGQLYMLVSNINQYFDNAYSKLPESKKVGPREAKDDIIEIYDLIKKNKELFSNVYIARIGYRGEGITRDMDYLAYMNIRLNQGGLNPKEAKETSSYFLSQIKDLLKQLKNVKVGGGKENDKQFKIGELKVLVPIEPNKEEPKKEEPKKEAPKPASKKETKELSKDEKQLQQLFINDARLKNKFKATKSPMISGLSPKERDIRSKIRIGIEKEIKENKFLLFDLEEKMKLKKEDDNIKAEKAKLKLFKLNVENFLKNPSEKLLEFIDINIELMDELPESKQDKLDKAIDKFENKKKQVKPTPTPKPKPKPKPTKEIKGELTDRQKKVLSSINTYLNDTTRSSSQATMEFDITKKLLKMKFTPKFTQEILKLYKKFLENNEENNIQRKNEIYLSRILKEKKIIKNF